VIYNALEAKEYGLVDEVLGDTSNLISIENKDPSIHFYSEDSKQSG
jgi:ATP-dependent Clp protease protease subunit